MTGNWSRAERWVFRGLTLVALAAGTWLAVAPVEQVPTANWDDKLMHLLGFAVLAGLADFGWVHGPYIRRAMPLLGYGVFIELVQYQLAYRSFELTDILADGLGLVLYAVLVPLLRRLPWVRRRWPAELRGRFGRA